MIQAIIYNKILNCAMFDVGALDKRVQNIESFVGYYLRPKLRISIDKKIIF